MIYDCFIFFNELDLLEIRLNELNSVVDKFVLVEATKTFSNKDKPLYFEQNKKRFSGFLDKIIHIVIDDYPDNITDWVIENHQRNAIMRGLANCKDDDIVLISDCDEIPSANAILENKDKPGLKIFDLDMYYYFFNLKASSTWPYGTRMLFYKDFKNICKNFDDYSKTVIKEQNIGSTPQKIRHINSGLKIKRSGWHFTYIGGAEFIIKKVTSFSHYNDVKKEDLDINKILKNIRIGNLRFNSSILIPVKIDSGFPKYLYKNTDKFKDFILIQTSYEYFLCCINQLKKIPKIFFKQLAYSVVSKEKLKKIEKFFKEKFRRK